ncbi:MAG: hypothetical protein QM612_02240 [Thermomonas sp.]|uniref:hypothetical protein n=1 Tax=Thermomonas sp. TaxID=1971895 RepID=UPI0039E36182
MSIERAYFRITRHARAARFWLLLVLAALTWLGVGQARATDCSSYAVGCTVQDAIDQCEYETDNWPVSSSYQHLQSRCAVSGDVNSSGYVRSTFCSSVNSCAGASVNTSSQYFKYGCPAGTQFNSSLNRCSLPKRSDEECLALNGDISSQGPITRTWSSYCHDSGCSSVIDNPEIITNSLGTTFYRGMLRYTGACAVKPADPDIADGKQDDNTPREECKAVAGQTMCIKPDGQQCATASTGKKFCWRPGETGEKGDENTLQVKGPGTDVPLPKKPATDDGDTYEPIDDPITTTTTKGDSSITTTIQNYKTQNNTEAGGKDGGKEGGEEGGDENGSTGGTTCDSPPVSSGDPLLSQIAMQAWQTRCAITARNKLQDDQANQLAGEGDGLDGVSVGSIFDGGGGVPTLNEGLLGSGGGQCSFGVPLELMGEPITLPAEFWSLASWIGFLIVALAYIWVAVKLGS